MGFLLSLLYYKFNKIIIMKNKNTRMLILSVFTLFIFSCSSDDSKGNDQGIEDEEIIEEEEEEEEETEETGIDASVVFENVIVDGGSKESGSLSTQIGRASCRERE